MFKNRYINIVLLISLIFLLSCSRRDLIDLNTSDCSSIVKVNITDVTVTKANENKLYKIFIYKNDNLIREKELHINDTLMLGEGIYDFIIFDESCENFQLSDINCFSTAKGLLKYKDLQNRILYTPRNIKVISTNMFDVKSSRLNIMDITLNVIEKSVSYQLMFEGAKESVDKCIVKQKGVAYGVKLSDNTPIYADDKDVCHLFEVSANNEFSNQVELLGAHPTDKEIEIQFEFTDNTTQKTRIDISKIDDSYMYSKKMIISADISYVNTSITALIKSWILVKDTLKI
jgi:hypothetical protein